MNTVQRLDNVVELIKYSYELGATGMVVATRPNLREWVEHLRKSSDIVDKLDFHPVLPYARGLQMKLSQHAITTLINIVLHVPDWILRLDEEHAQKVMRRAASYYREVNERLVNEARLKPELRGMGTTMTGAYSLGDDLFVIHVGDSRAYLYRDGILRRLTKDHTHAQMLADAGIIRPEAVGTHRLRHVLTNALGGEESEGNAEIHRMRLFDGDRILLCSDGLHDMVEDEEIAEILKRERASNPACEALVKSALDNGGKDNVTVVVAGYRIPEVS